MSINSKNGSYIDDSLGGHVFAPNLANIIANFLMNENCKSVADYGCGPGWYTNIISSKGILCDGYDANAFTETIAKRCNYSGNFYILDLTEPHLLKKKYNWILSLEVGEHIPPQYEDILINNIINNCSDGIILSWAIEGQDGPGHVNCKNNDYIKNKFINLGYVNDLETENLFRQNTDETACWFRNTIMVFRKK